MGHLRLRLRGQLIARATYLAKPRFADSAQREGNGATDWRGWGRLGPQFAVFSLQCSARGGGSRRETMNEKRKMQSGRRAAD